MALTESYETSQQAENASKPDEIEVGGAKFTKELDNVDVDVKPTTKLIGLTKEQLEQYRNDPFWKPVRYGLFIAFWLIWVAMFVGAILIVVLSPKCEPKGTTGIGPSASNISATGHH